ncbi:SH3 domain-binding protein 5-like [Watersipora subatra]|uniref:SH3 domain-binding protein 5-like n=1 Tax=Watersipora subatra TaxID=2589382 RepID=UPI00355C7B9A
MQQTDPHRNEDEEMLDPRIQHELDLMNTSAVLINKFENDLRLAQQCFHDLYKESVDQLNKEASKVGRSINKAMPYYDSRMKLIETQDAVKDALIKYERAVSVESAAREVVELTEKGYEAKRENRSFSNFTWQEILNKATNKLLDAEFETAQCENCLLQANQLHASAQSAVRKQRQRNRKSIVKSKQYYEMKSKFHHKLEAQKDVIARIEEDCSTAKTYYSRSMANLEMISNEIHSRRQLNSCSKDGADADYRRDAESLDTNMIVKAVQNEDVNYNSSDVPNYNVSEPFTEFSMQPSLPAASCSLNRSSTSSDFSSTFSIQQSDDGSSTAASTMDKRSASYADITLLPSDTQPLSKPRSNSAPSSFSKGTSSDVLDNSMDSLSNSVLDDQCLEDALSSTYFKNENSESPRVATPPCLSSSQISVKHHDYYTLPSQLSGYQKHYTLRRTSAPAASVGPQDVKKIFSLLRVDDRV